MADRIVIMKDGHIQQIGTPAQVYHQPANAFVAQFIGAPSMNMLPATSSENSVILQSGQSLNLPHSSPAERDVVIGVRPDDLLIGAGQALVTGTVTVQEPLGPDTLIYVETPLGEVIAKADGRTPPDVGSEVTLSADPENLHVFDANTGAALT